FLLALPVVWQFGGGVSSAGFTVVAVLSGLMLVAAFVHGRPGGCGWPSRCRPPWSCARWCTPRSGSWAPSSPRSGGTSCTCAATWPAGCRPGSSTTSWGIRPGTRRRSRAEPPGSPDVDHGTPDGLAAVERGEGLLHLAERVAPGDGVLRAELSAGHQVEQD